MMGNESGGDRADRASGGLSADRSECFQRLGSAIATYDILRIAVGSLDVDGKKNVKDGTSAGTRM
jgi:hypothetical protein